MVNVTINGVYNRLKDWLMINNLGGNVTDYCLDLLNRANSHLGNKPNAPDFPILKRVALALVNREAALPSDCISVVRVYPDTDLNNYPDTKLFNKSAEISEGYEVYGTFSKDTGHTKTIKLYVDIGSSISVEYRASYPVYAGTKAGELYVEYLLFPEELTFRAAQYLIVVDKGLAGDEYQKIRQSYNEEWGNYMVNIANANLDPKNFIYDPYGMPYYPSYHDMRGGYGGAGGTIRDNSMHPRRFRY